MIATTQINQRSPNGAVVNIHPAAICESIRVGTGTNIWANAHVHDGAIIGQDCSICDHVYVEGGARIGDRVVVKNGALLWNGVTIEDDVFIGPGVVFTNDRYPRSRRSPSAAPRYASEGNWLVPTRIAEGASLGAGAIILCGITIGKFASVGAGAVVTTDVEPHRIVVGNPARPAGWACSCGHPLPCIEDRMDPVDCPECGRTYELYQGVLVRGN